ncbi:MAG: addiction module protein [Ginsengibacter sp.]
MSYNKENLLSLPVKEKLELVTALWESIDNDTLGRDLSNYEIEQEIANRINKIIKNPETLISWEEVKNKMRV